MLHVTFCTIWQVDFFLSTDLAVGLFLATISAYLFIRRIVGVVLLSTYTYMIGISLPCVSHHNWCCSTQIHTSFPSAHTVRSYIHIPTHWQQRFEQSVAVWVYGAEILERLQPCRRAVIRATEIMGNQSARVEWPGMW